MKDLLSEEERSFIEEIRSSLSKAGVAFHYENKSHLVGLRDTKKGKLLFYFCKANGVTMIYRYSKAENRNVGEVFDNKKKEEYLRSVLDCFGIKALYKKDVLLELRSRYFYAVESKRVRRITILEIVPNESIDRLYYAYRDGSRRFCDLRNASRHLFGTKEEALASIKGAETTVSLTSMHVFRRRFTRGYVVASGNQFFMKMEPATRFRNSYPLWTMTLTHAMVFSDLESAERAEAELKEFIANVEIVNLEEL